MKKFWWALVIIIVLIILAVIIVYQSLPGWVSSDLSQKAGVEVSIDDIELRPGKIEVEQLKIANPKGSKLDDALKVEEITAKAPLRGYFKDHIKIDRLTLDDVYFSLEFDHPNTTQGNWSQIADNLSKNADAGEDKKEKHVLIEELVLNDVQIEMYTHGSGEEVKKLKKIDHLTFRNVTSSGGIPTAQIMNVVIQQALKEIFSKENLKNMLEDVFKPKDHSKKDGWDSLKDFFSQSG